MINDELHEDKTGWTGYHVRGVFVPAAAEIQRPGAPESLILELDEVWGSNYGCTTPHLQKLTHPDSSWKNLPPHPSQKYRFRNGVWTEGLIVNPTGTELYEIARVYWQVVSPGSFSLTFRTFKRTVVSLAGKFTGLPKFVSGLSIMKDFMMVKALPAPTLSQLRFGEICLRTFHDDHLETFRRLSPSNMEVCQPDGSTPLCDVTGTPPLTTFPFPNLFFRLAAINRVHWASMHTDRALSGLKRVCLARCGLAADRGSWATSTVLQIPRQIPRPLYSATENPG